MRFNGSSRGGVGAVLWQADMVSARDAHWWAGGALNIRAARIGASQDADNRRLRQLPRRGHGARPWQFDGGPLVGGEPAIAVDAHPDGGARRGRAEKGCRQVEAGARGLLSAVRECLGRGGGCARRRRRMERGLLEALCGAALQGAPRRARRGYWRRLERDGPFAQGAVGAPRLRKVCDATKAAAAARGRRPWEPGAALRAAHRWHALAPRLRPPQPIPLPLL